MQVFKLITGSMRTNCFIVSNDGSSECLIIDPGNDADKIVEFLSEKRLTPAAVLLTHGHFDHILGLKKLLKIYSMPVYALAEEKALLEHAEINCSADFHDDFELSPDVLLKDGEIIKPAEVLLKVLKTPGHTKGSCCYYSEDAGIIFTGDTLFFRTIGSTDFPTGDFKEICDSLVKLKNLPEETVVYTGHGPDTTIGSEKRQNLYLRGL